MKKKMMAVALAMVLTAASSVAVYAFTCEVVAVNGGKVELKCKEKYTKKLKVGKKVKVSARKKLEGC